MRGRSTILPTAGSSTSGRIAITKSTGKMVLSLGYLGVKRGLARLMEATSAYGREKWCRDLVQNAPDLIMTVDAGCRVHYVNHSVGRVLGHTPEHLIGRVVSEYLHPEEADHVQGLLISDPDGAGSAGRTLEFRLRHADGTWHYFEVNMTGWQYRPGTKYKALFIRDVTERKARENDLIARAQHDPLTGLANRRLLIDRIDHAVKRAARKRIFVAVLFLDLDDFKAVNDSFGHETGDLLLTAVGRRLQASLRPGDTAARLGGDEFAVLFEDVEDASVAMRLKERVLEILQAPVAVGQYKLAITVSAGIALSDSSMDRADKLLRVADSAMYKAKRRVKSRRETFDGGVLVQPLECNGWEDRLGAQGVPTVERYEALPLMRCGTGRGPYLSGTVSDGAIPGPSIVNRRA